MVIVLMYVSSGNAKSHDYGDALSKSLLFFEGQRSGKLPSTQRMTWRKDSALRDGSDKGVDLSGGYYDAGDNVKFNFPMAFTITMMAWGVMEQGKSMGTELPHALEAVRWATDYFLKCTAAAPTIIYAQVGDPFGDHNCWQRPEDMDTPRTVYAVTPDKPGSEVAAETAAALAAASLAFRDFGDEAYGKVLLERAVKVFEFADKYRGTYNDSIGEGACPFYCDYSGYQDELLWGAAWLYKATNEVYYWNYVKENIITFKAQIEGANFEFGWDSKHAGISVLVSNWVLNNSTEASTTPFLSYADSFMCSLMPESPTKTFQFTPGGLLMKEGNCDLQQVTSISFLVLAYNNYLKNSTHVIRCNDKIINQTQLVNFTKNQVDYILGSNPLNISYMVGYGDKFPRRIHHRGSSIPSLDQHPDHIACKEGTPYFQSTASNPNELTGAVVRGPEIDDSFADARANSSKSEPATYITSPLVGLLAYFSEVSAH
ncbi:endoglucanase 8-like isoform X1 [Salvia hispanica]|uniref:endoglucanase 8-like isoform X1 n=1 Tax=Salvia hispanica TaxID=49212 RepID=UPI002009B876|nr:endoglucanase 8-like isoform X1 [Salvia hispanica]